MIHKQKVIELIAIKSEKEKHKVNFIDNKQDRKDLDSENLELDEIIKKISKFREKRSLIDFWNEISIDEKD